MYTLTIYIKIQSISARLSINTVSTESLNPTYSTFAWILGQKSQSLTIVLATETSSKMASALCQKWFQKQNKQTNKNKQNKTKKTAFCQKAHSFT